MIRLDIFNATGFGRQRAQQHLLDAIKKFENGDGIDDGELKMLIKFYEAAEGIIHTLGKFHELSRRDVDQKLYTLHRFRDSRKRSVEEKKWLRKIQRKG
jgi:hypothetical protein